MKKTLKLIIPFLLVFVTVFTLSITAGASDFERDLEIGQEWSLPFSETDYVSSDTSVVEIIYEGDYDYTAVAIGPGTAKITGGTWGSSYGNEYTINVSRPSLIDTMIDNPIFGVTLGSIAYIVQMGVVFLLIAVCLSLVIAEIIYIYVTAPKCGMSRLWALAPLFSNVLGLIVFIVVKTNNKTMSPKNKITCPTCGSVHHVGTAVCSICGTHLQ